MNKLPLLLLVLSASAQSADINHIGDGNLADTKIIVGMASRHFNSDDHKYLNETNPSIGLEMWDIQAVYVNKNSWGNRSLYLTYAPDYEINNYLSVSMQTGIATGYKCDAAINTEEGVYRNDNCTSSEVVPLVALTLDIKPTGKDFALSFSVTPDVAMFSFSYEL